MIDCKVKAIAQIRVCASLLIVGCLTLTNLGAANVGANAGDVNSVDIVIETDNVLVEIETLDSFEAEQARLRELVANKPSAYQDKVMSETNLEALAQQAEQAAAEASQPPSGQQRILLENRLNFSQNTSDSATKRRDAGFDMRGEYRTETRNYGDWLLQADTNARYLDDTRYEQWHKQEEQRHIRLRNIDFPLTETLSATTDAGDINSTLGAAFRQGNARAALGTQAVRGMGTQIYADNYEIQLGHGRIEQNPFNTQSHHPVDENSELSWFAYSYKINETRLAGLQFNQLRSDSTRNTAYNLALTVAHGHHLNADGDKKFRALWLHSQGGQLATDGDKRAQGIFLDMGLKQGRNKYEFGAYYTDPQLQYNGYNFQDDRRGAWLNVEHQRAHWRINGGFSFEQQGINDPAIHAREHSALHVQTHYQLSRNDSLSTQLRWSRSEQQQPSTSHGHQSLHSHITYQTRFADYGTSRFSATLRHNQTIASNAPSATGETLQWEQDWNRSQHETMRPELRTSLGIARDRSERDTQIHPTAGLHIRHWLDADWDVSANLRYSARHGNLTTSQGLSGSINTHYQLGKGWSLSASIGANEARVESSNILGESLASRSRGMNANLALRWENTRGKPFPRSGQSKGSGSIRGRLFADENGDGQQQTDELGLANVEISLDNRYQTRTDQQGNFSFEQVATGTYTLSIRPENLPLPWGLADKAELSVDVPLRGTVVKDITAINISR